MARMWVQRMKGGSAATLLLGCVMPACAPVEARVSCWADLDVPMDSFIRTKAEFDEWASHAPEDTECSLAPLESIDWETHSLAVLTRGGTSDLLGMTVRGKHLVVRTKGNAQCGGAPVSDWGGINLVVVPSEVRDIKAHHRKAPRCPNRNGPPPV